MATQLTSLWPLVALGGAPPRPARDGPRAPHRRRRRAAASASAAAAAAAAAEPAAAAAAAAAEPAARLRVFAVSDLHVDYAENMAWVRSLGRRCGGEDFSRDALLVCGDVSDELALLAEALGLLAERFGRVFFVPGNHDVWVRRGDAAPDSAAKAAAALEAAAALGVETQPAPLDAAGRVWAAPVLSWHAASFDADPDVPGTPRPALLADYSACAWPGAALAAPGGDALAAFWDGLNDAAPRWAALEAARAAGADVVSFSHFLPRPELLPEKRYLIYPALAKAVGSHALRARVARLAPDIHIFGHTHFAWDATLDGVRYIQAPLCAPSERARRARTVSFDALAARPGGADRVAAALPLQVYEAALALAPPPAAAGARGGGAAAALRRAAAAGGAAPHGAAPRGAAPRARQMGVPAPDVAECGAARAAAPRARGAAAGVPLRHGTMPGPLGAHWSDHYAQNPRTPEDTTLAPWVAVHYAGRRRRHARRQQEREAAREAGPADAEACGGGDSSGGASSDGAP